MGGADALDPGQEPAIRGSPPSVSSPGSCPEAQATGQQGWCLLGQPRSPAERWQEVRGNPEQDSLRSQARAPGEPGNQGGSWCSWRPGSSCPFRDPLPL